MMKARRFPGHSLCDVGARRIYPQIPRLRRHFKSQAVIVEPVDAKVCNLLIGQQQLRRQPPLHILIDVIDVLNIERHAVPDIGDNQPLILFGIEIGAVPPAGAY